MRLVARPDQVRDDAQPVAVLLHLSEHGVLDIESLPDPFQITAGSRLAEDCRVADDTQTPGFGRQPRDDSVGEAACHAVEERRLATLFVTGGLVRTRINRRQDMPSAWTMNGAIYLFRTAVLFDAPPSLYGGSTAAYTMSPERGLSIDDLADWIAAERALA